MVDTIKFSQMPSAGNINNNDIMPSLRSGENVLLNNPWTFLPPGSTAQRPTPSSTINYRLRFNTDDQLYEYYDATLGAWTQLQESAFTQGPFLTYAASASLPDAQNLGALADGILKQTITLGVATLDIAVNGTDYYGPGFVIPGTDGGTGINNGARTINLGSPTTGYVLTSDSSGNATWRSVSTSGAITTINGNSGSVTPTAGVVTINGGSTGLTTTGSSSTLSLGGLLNSTFGGTGVSNPTAHGIMIGEGASPMTPIVLSSGQILIGSTGADPVAAAINSGTSVLVANGAGSITVGLAPIATLNILSNITGGSAAPIANTLTATIDAALGSTQGDILYRNGTVWTVLAPGTSGQFLTSGGPAANVSWSPQVAPTGQALTEVNDTNVTLTLGGSPTVALLAATSLTLGWTGTLSGARGGTGVNNSSSTATYAGNLNFAAAFSTSGAFAVTQTYTGITNVTFPTTGTLATTSQIPTGAALTKTDDTNVTLLLGGSPTTALVNAASLTLGWTGLLSIARGGTAVSSVTTSPTATAWAGWDANKNLSANNFIAGYTTTATAAGNTILTVASTSSQFFTGVTTQTVTMPVASTLTTGHHFYVVNNSSGAVTVNSSGGNAIQVMAAGTTCNLTCILNSGTSAASWYAEYAFQSGSSTGTVNSGSTNQLAWYAANGTAVSGLATGNNGVLVTSAGGVPSISSMLPQFIGMTSPNITTSINDVNNNQIFGITPVASAVNYIQVINSASTNPVTLQALGTATNLTLQLQGKGTGGAAVLGTSTNDSASAGYVGEIISSEVLIGAPVSISSNVAKDITTISLTAGQWNVFANIGIVGAAGTTVDTMIGCINTSTAISPASRRTFVGYGVSYAIGAGDIEAVVPSQPMQLSGTTTIHLVIQSQFNVSTMSAFGYIWAIRVR